MRRLARLRLRIRLIPKARMRFGVRAQHRVSTSVWGLLARLWRYMRDGPLDLGGPEYHHFRRIIIPTARGTTEIDHLIVSPYGIFVVELKDRSGWIFADAYAPRWTADHFGRKFTFQNPLHQNFGHLKALEEFLGVDARVLLGIVVFRGAFQFKTPIPAGVLCHRYDKWVAAHQEVVLDDAAVRSITHKLHMDAYHGWLAGLRHARSVRERLASDTTCPKCGGALRQLTQRRGPNPGSQFLGCSNYPRCRFTRPLSVY